MITVTLYRNFVNETQDLVMIDIPDTSNEHIETTARDLWLEQNPDTPDLVSIGLHSFIRNES